MDVILVSESPEELRFKALLESGRELGVSVFDRGALNRREYKFDVLVNQGTPWQVVTLSMPNGNYAWRIADKQHASAGSGDYHASAILALRAGAIPYIVAQDRRWHGGCS